MNNKNNKYIDDTIPPSVFELLNASQSGVSDTTKDRLARYLTLVREWNDYASLVSQADLARLSSRHLPDALSLAPVIKRLGCESGALLDIGSGGGFPAIPLGIAMPGLKVTLVERSQKKLAFLQKVIGTLGLSQVKIVGGTFPEAVRGLEPNIVTARAVEEPGKLMGQILSYLPEDAFFLCQVPKAKMIVPELFHVEQVEDEWTAQSFRLGSLCILSHQKT